MLVVILTSLFPLPLDKLRDWIVSKTNLRPKPVKLLPCSKLSVTEVWSIKLPKLTSESPIRALDVNMDGVEDVIFGYGTGKFTDCLKNMVKIKKSNIQYKYGKSQNAIHIHVKIWRFLNLDSLFLKPAKN